MSNQLSDVLPVSFPDIADTITVDANGYLTARSLFMYLELMGPQTGQTVFRVRDLDTGKLYEISKVQKGKPMEEKLYFHEYYYPILTSPTGVPGKHYELRATLTHLSWDEFKEDRFRLVRSVVEVQNAKH